MSLEAAIRLIPDGAHVTFSGFAHTLTPMAAVREIVRQGKKNLLMTGIAECWAADMLIGAGAIAKLYLSNFMFEGYGRCRNFSRAIEDGSLPVEDYSHFGLANRFAAAALGVPFLPVKSMLGSDVLQDGFDAHKWEIMNCPFTGEKVLLLPKSQPDFAIIHGHRADADGNIQIIGAKSVVEEQVRAAKTVIATVEKIVDTAVIRENPELTVVPGMLVSAVVEVPYGAHPTGMYRMYDYDHDHIRSYVAASQDPKSFAEYLAEYAHLDHGAYLNKIGTRHLLELRADPFLGYRNPDLSEVK